jgi:hypothetical protein
LENTASNSTTSDEEKVSSSFVLNVTLTREDRMNRRNEIRNEVMNAVSEEVSE